MRKHAAKVRGGTTGYRFRREETAAAPHREVRTLAGSGGAATAAPPVAQAKQHSGGERPERLGLGDGSHVNCEDGVADLAVQRGTCPGDQVLTEIESRDRNIE